MQLPLYQLHVKSFGLQNNEDPMVQPGSRPLFSKYYVEAPDKFCKCDSRLCEEQPTQAVSICCRILGSLTFRRCNYGGQQKKA